MEKRFLNPIAEALTGWRLSEAREKELSEVFKLVDENTQPSVNDPVTTALDQDTTIYLDHPIYLRTKDGKTIPVGDSAAVVKDNKGAIAGVVLVFRDITSSVQLEQANSALVQALEQLRRAQAQLIQSEKMSSIGQLAAVVINEINNPASVIYGNLPLARQYFQDLLSLIELYKHTYSNPTPNIANLTETIDLDFLVEDWPKLLDSMQSAVERIQEIVTSLLFLSSFPQLNQLDLKPLDIHEGIDNILRILRHRLRAEGHRPEIQVIKVYAQLPKITCYASQINQVFMHILSNAIDALEGKLEPRIITIRTEIQPDSPNNLEAKSTIVHITDNGCGMSEEVQKKIFEPFFTTKSDTRSNGLGLSISYQIIVDRHKGQIECHSIPGLGTEFVITLPMTQS
jgi:PAS domain S-box-containing protein